MVNIDRAKAREQSIHEGITNAKEIFKRILFTEHLTNFQNDILIHISYNEFNVHTYYQMALWDLGIYKNNRNTQALGGLDNILKRHGYQLEFHDWNNMSLGFGVRRTNEDVQSFRDRMDLNLRQTLIRELSQAYANGEFAGIEAFSLDDSLHICFPEIDLGELPKLYVALTQSNGEFFPLIFDTKEQLLIFETFVKSGGYIDQVVVDNFIKTNRKNEKSPRVKSEIISKINEVCASLTPGQEFIQNLSRSSGYVGYGLNGDPQRRVKFIEKTVRNNISMAAQMLMIQDGLISFEDGESVSFIDLRAIDEQLLPWQQFGYCPQLVCISKGDRLTVAEVSEAQAQLMQELFAEATIEKNGKRQHIGRRKVSFGDFRGKGGGGSIDAEIIHFKANNIERLYGGYRNLIQVFRKRGYQQFDGVTSNRVAVEFPQFFPDEE